MTTYISSRDAIVGYINTRFGTDKPTVKLVWEGQPAVDLDTAPPLFVRVEIDFDDAFPITVNDVPEHEVQGTVYFTIFSKEASGTRPVIQMIDYITDTFKFQSASAYKFGQPTPGRKQAVREGWGTQVVEAPFRFYSIPANW